MSICRSMSVSNLGLIFSLLNLSLACIPTIPPPPDITVRERVVKVLVPAATMPTTTPIETTTRTTTTTTSTTTTTAPSTTTACVPEPACQTEVLAFAGVLEVPVSEDLTITLTYVAPTLTLTSDCAEDGAMLLVSCPIGSIPVNPGIPPRPLGLNNVGRLTCTSLGWVGNTVALGDGVTSVVTDSVSCIDVAILGDILPILLEAILG